MYEEKTIKDPMYKIMAIMEDLGETPIFPAFLCKAGLKGNKFRLAARKYFLMKCIINL